MKSILLKFMPLSSMSFTSSDICMCYVILTIHVTSVYGYRPKDVIQAVIVSSMGRLLVIPALIWGQTYSTIGVILTRLFVFFSNVQALHGNIIIHCSAWMFRFVFVFFLWGVVAVCCCSFILFSLVNKQIFKY